MKLDDVLLDFLRRRKLCAALRAWERPAGRPRADFKVLLRVVIILLMPVEVLDRFEALIAHGAL